MYTYFMYDLLLVKYIYLTSQTNTHAYHKQYFALVSWGNDTFRDS